MKNRLFLLTAVLLLALTVCLAACTAIPDDPIETETRSETETETRSETETESETVMSAAETATETETETEYDDPTLALDHLSIGSVDIANFTVVVPAEPASLDQQAAEFIIRFIGEATGVTLPKITDAESAEHMILVGTTAHDTAAVVTARGEITGDGYAMLVDSGHLYITGALDQGTLFGTYDFLEKYVGLRLYGVNTYPEQTELYEIKQHLRVNIPSDLRTVYSSPIAIRMTSWTAFFEAEAVYPRWNGYNREDLDHVGWVHTIGRLAETGGDLTPQPCLTSEEIYRTVLKNVRAWMAENPNARYISVSQNDSIEHCECENCLAVEAEEGSASGPWIRFVNRIANDIKEEYPNVMVETLAYSYTQAPPKVTKPVENVAVRLCTIGACFAHAIDDPNCPQNVTFCHDLEEWSKICDHMMIWTYAANFAAGDACGMGPNIHVILKEAKYYRDHNVKYVYAEATQHPEGQLSTAQGELRAYLWGKALWNPDMSQEEFDGYISDFMNYYYGDAAPLLLKYLTRLNDSLYDNTEHDEHMNGHTDPFANWRRFMHVYDSEGNPSDAYVNELAAIWAEIDAIDTLTESQQLHVDAVALQFWRIAYNTKNDVAYRTKDQNIRRESLKWMQCLQELRAQLDMA